MVNFFARTYSVIVLLLRWTTCIIVLLMSVLLLAGVGFQLFWWDW
jgi:hypothetical protein